MDIDFSKALQGFDEVWARVQKQKPAKQSNPGTKAKAQHSKPQSRANRFNPGRR